VRRLAALAALQGLLGGCAVPPPGTKMAPEVTLHGVKLRNFHNSTLSAVGSASDMTYERATADVHSQNVTLDVFQLEPPPPPGVRPPATHLEAKETLGNLLTRGIDATEGVTARLPTGLFGRTSHAFFDSPEMRATGASQVVLDGPDGFWLRADGFDLHLRTDVYDFVNPETRTRGP
jgi:hypothetical protein